MNNAFAINGFTGMTHDQIVSFWIMIAITGYYTTLIAASLTAFSFASRPGPRGRVHTAALWQLPALFFYVISVTSLVWGAPAEKSFFNDSTRTGKIIFGLVLSVIGAIFMVAGVLHAQMQKRGSESSAPSGATAY